MAIQTPEKNQDFQIVDFSLPDIGGKIYTLDDCRGPKGTVVAFICNHCPYVKNSIDRLVADAKVLQQAGIGFITIMSNDTEAYPADSFENMKIFARDHHFTFPYLIDETQDIARAYGAVCTPDIFGFNAGGMLQYRGRIDSAGSKPAGPDTKRELCDALLEIARTGQGPAEQTPSMGCSIKWRP